jgi:hypothetical protein
LFSNLLLSSIHAVSNDQRVSFERAFRRLGPELHDELPPPFTIAEYEARWRRVKQELELEPSVDQMWLDAWSEVIAGA